ncbi:helix-turn-helix domain-containing protein [Edaphovirga cremea]|uniref:helix-turn-helix domain-containing protein n=1 Tax=Edaphovirga cremea TaxID=2267246 RepID=UPI000DEF053C|nr:LuxR C-terminal-related transcriptional regulator [Edaphovirga cremea]
MMNVHIISNDQYMLAGLRQLMKDKREVAINSRPLDLRSHNKAYLDPNRVLLICLDSESEIVALLSLLAETNSRVIIMGKNADDEIFSHYCGCHYIPKNSSVEDFNFLFDAIMHSSTLHIKNVLTTREKTVIKELLQGRPGASVAKKLDISQKTISSHKRSALHKLGLKNINQATLLSKILIQQNIEEFII